MQALQRHQYGPAADLFRSLINQFPGERALLERARVYLGICERELARRPVEPVTLEERVTAATAALNNGDEARAERLARAALAEDPRHDLALYLLAAIEARRGASDAALSFLRDAIDVSPEASAQARHDPDFEGLRHIDAFRALTEPPPPASHPRRPRRGRA
jgi:tetratricopeptide (TPR) repeat protein